MSAELQKAMTLAEKQPGNDEAWDALEQLAQDNDCPDEVADAYARALKKTDDKEVANKLGQRAVSFLEEYFGADAPALPKILAQILSIDAQADWAFQRLTTVHTVAERWPELFALYDKVLASADPERRMQLLQEAHQTAKELANDVERSISYLYQLNKLKPDTKRTESLAKLLEKHERWGELIELWETRLPELKKDERQEAVLQIAKTLVQAIGAPNDALPWLEKLIADGNPPNAVWTVLQNVFEHAGASPATRKKALDLLSTYFDRDGKSREVIRLLNAALEFPEVDSDALRLQIAERLSKLNDAGAFDHYAKLLLNDPSSKTLQKSLRGSVQGPGELERYAQVLADAADKVKEPARRIALLADAAKTRLDNLEDEAGAIPLFLKALNTNGISQSDVLGIGRRLNELLSRAERHADRLPVLDALAKAEPVDSNKKALIGDIAQLSDKVGDVDRALDAWRRRLELDSNDVAALDAMASLLEREGRSGALIETLRRRAATNTDSIKRRSDLVRVAEVYEKELGNPAQAIDAWLEVQKNFGDSNEVVSALTRLLAVAGSWKDLAELLESVNKKEVHALTERYGQLGDAYSQYLQKPERALRVFSTSLRVDPENKTARAGLAQLLHDDAHRRVAADVLARNYRETEDWRRYLDLVDARLSDAEDVGAKLVILSEAADIREHRLDDAAGAVPLLGLAFTFTPSDRGLEQRLKRLARATGQWSTAISAYESACASAQSDAQLVAHLRFEQAQIYETETTDLSSAFRAFSAVIDIEPDNLIATASVIRLGGKLGQWDACASALCKYVSVTKVLEASLVGDLEAGADAAGQFDELCQALSKTLAKHDLPARIQADLLWCLATWHTDRRSNDEDAEKVLRRLVSIDPRREPALRKLADVERRLGRASREKTLALLSELNPSELPLFTESAELALQSGADAQGTHDRLLALYARAGAAWRAGDEQASAQVRWAVEKLLSSFTELGRVTQALDFLVEASRLPFPKKEQLELRARAAQIASESGDVAAAIEMYRAVLSQDPANRNAILALRSLYQTQGRLPELLALQKHQLSLNPPVSERLQLRLELSETLAAIEREGGRIGALRANLAEEPGHEQSLASLVEVLQASARYDELLEALTDQATRLEERADNERAADIWIQAADIAENQLGDKRRAFIAHERVVDLVNRGDSLDALARMAIEGERHSEAVPWLERRLAQCNDEDRPRVAIRLARAHLGADRPERAVGCLERAVAQGYADLGIYKLLADLYRQQQRWQELADLLSDGLAAVTEESMALAWSVEAADLYTNRLKTPAKAVPALERAIKLDPENLTLRKSHAVGLRVAGRLDEAKSILEGLISGFGRRRSPERAAIHMELALVARAQGNLEQAVEELTLASRMDANNAQMQWSLAESAREHGNLELANQTLRALLLLVRREPPGDDESAVGPSEVFFEMMICAEQKGDQEKASELLASVVEAAVQSDHEVRRLRRTALAHNRAELVVDVLQQRLKSEEAPASKAKALSELADVYERSMGRDKEAYDARLTALELSPQLADNVERGRKLASKLKKSAQFMSKVEAVTESLRRDEEQEVVGQLMMALGTIAEEDLNDPGRAKEFYARAEQHRAHRVEALYAQARTAAPEQQQRALDELRDIALGEEHIGRRADALYRLASLELLAARFLERGLDTLDNAIRIEPRYLDAAQILREAADAWENAPQVLAIYEQVARSSRSDELLLDYLERQAQSPKATPEQVREAVKLAEKVGEPQRGEALLERAIEAAKAGKTGLAGATWAVRSLIKVRISANDLPAARDLLLELLEIDEWEPVFELGLSLTRAAEQSDATLALAADVYEVLRQRDGQNKLLWEPLFAIYQRLGAPDRLFALVMSTLPLLMDLGDRNLMRRRSSSFFLAQGKLTEAKELLANALADDPDDNEAAVALEQILRRENDIEGLTLFLSRRYADARQRGVTDTIAEVALQYGGLVAEYDADQAREIYASALEWAPSHLRLIRATLDLTNSETQADSWAELMSRRIFVEEESQVPELALSLAANRQERGDVDGTRQALENGYRRTPNDSVLRQCLQDFYRDLDLWNPLADMMVHQAEIAPDPVEALVRYRDAASIYRDQLRDPPGAARVLHAAWNVDRANVPLVAELAAAQTAAHDTAAAITTLTAALDIKLQESQRTELLLLRSSLYQSKGDGLAAIADLESAFDLDRVRVQPLLAECLDAVRVAAQERNDIRGEREATLRLVQMSRAAGAMIAARELLFRWIERYADDREALILLRDMDEEVENWEGVIAACSRLALIEEGDAQVDAALRLYRATEKLSSIDHARPTLEHVLRVQPHRHVVREFLRHVYKECGHRRELAELLLVEAEQSDDIDSKYQNYRTAADIFVNEFGDAEAALPAAQKAQALKPDDHDTVLVLADVLTASNRIDEALAILEPAVNAQKRRTPELAALQHRLSRVHGHKGDQDTQLYWLKKAFDVDRKNGVIAAELAQIATAIGDYELALKPLRAITLMDSPGPVTRVMALLWEAKIENERGNRAKAELWAKKALREDPNFQEAAEFLEEIAE